MPTPTPEPDPFDVAAQASADARTAVEAAAADHALKNRDARDLEARLDRFDQALDDWTIPGLQEVTGLHRHVVRLVESGDTTYVVVDGEVDVVADGRTLAVRGKGDVIGEMSVISSRPRVASLRAKSDVRVLEIHKPAFQAILRERPDTALALMRVLCERLAPDDPATS